MSTVTPNPAVTLRHLRPGEMATICGCARPGARRDCVLAFEAPGSGNRSTPTFSKARKRETGNTVASNCGKKAGVAGDAENAEVRRPLWLDLGPPELLIGPKRLSLCSPSLPSTRGTGCLGAAKHTIRSLIPWPGKRWQLSCDTSNSQSRGRRNASKWGCCSPADPIRTAERSRPISTPRLLKIAKISASRTQGASKLSTPRVGHVQGHKTRPSPQLRLSTPELRPPGMITSGLHYQPRSAPSPAPLGPTSQRSFPQTCGGTMWGTDMHDTYSPTAISSEFSPEGPKPMNDEATCAGRCQTKLAPMTDRLYYSLPNANPRVS